MSRKTIRRCSVAAIAVGVLLSVTATPASAQTADHRAFFTFSGPVELPGVGLAPGKYMFRLADPLISHNVVQVLNADGTRSYGIFFTVPTVRPDPAPAPEVRFMEAAAGAPPPIRAWWNVGETTGHEFIYPKEQARRLARNSKEPVLTTQSQTTTTEQTNTGNLVRLSADGRETDVKVDGHPAASAAGTSQAGEAADSSLVLPPVILVLVPADAGR